MINFIFQEIGIIRLNPVYSSYLGYYWGLSVQGENVDGGCKVKGIGKIRLDVDNKIR